MAANEICDRLPFMAVAWLDSISRLRRQRRSNMAVATESAATGRVTRAMTRRPLRLDILTPEGAELTVETGGPRWNALGPSSSTSRSYLAPGLSGWGKAQPASPWHPCCHGIVCRIERFAPDSRIRPDFFFLRNLLFRHLRIAPAGRYPGKRAIGLG